MSKISRENPAVGFVFACTKNTEKKCLERSVFASTRAFGPVTIRVKKGNLLFLHNLDSGRLYGVFKACSDGSFNPQSKIWSRKFPYQVKVKAFGRVISLENSEIESNRLEINGNKRLLGKKLIQLVEAFSANAFKRKRPLLGRIRRLLPENRKTLRRLSELAEGINNNPPTIDIEEEIPLLEATTLWIFGRQSYGKTLKGDNMYPGVTPAQLIYNLVWRYTDPGDLVVDPMCGSGTTIDVCNEEKRSVIGYDIAPKRPDISKNDSRNIPLGKDTADMVFVDSPYGDNIKYSDEPACIGNISSENGAFYDELEKVISECHRILKPGKVLAWLIGDQWVKDRFTPVGLKIYERLCKYLEPLQIIAVARRGQSSNTSVWFNRARRLNFYLQGFKYLFIMRKQLPGQPQPTTPRKIDWKYYQRGKR